MRWLTTLLTVYLLGLSLWPCADEALPVRGQGNTVVSTKAGVPYSGASHEHHDQCTPFCTCACCSAIITTAPSFTYTLTYAPDFVPTLAASTFVYTLLHWADPLAAIWQPPKLRV